MSQQQPATKLGPATAYMIAVGIMLLDQAMKTYVTEAMHLATRGSIPLLGPLHLTLVWNRGVTFGLFTGDTKIVRWALTGFAVIMSLVLGWWAKSQHRILPLAGIGLIMGGAIGNVIDRVRYGAVIDFIDASALYFPWVFNVADACIDIGVVLLLIDMVRNDRPSQDNAKGDAE